MSVDGGLAARVRQVIEASGQTQVAFARSIELDPTKLSKALAGVRRFTPLELALIADQGGTSTDWLLRGGPRRPRVAARAQPAAAPDAAERACARAEEYGEVYDTLAELGHGRPVATTLPRASTARLVDARLVDARLVDAGAELAGAARRSVLAAGMVDAVATDLPAVIETVFGIDVAIEDLPTGFDGLAWRRHGPGLILISNATSWTRQRFTLAHELGHLLAGDAQDLLVDVDVMQRATRGPSETRANAFAAEFLMPQSTVDTLLPPDEPVTEHAFARLVGELRVSPSALSWRLKSLGRIDDAERATLGTLTLWRCAERGGWTDTYRAYTAAQSETRPPGPLGRAALDAFAAGAVSARVPALVLGIAAETLLPEAGPAEPSFTP